MCIYMYVYIEIYVDICLHDIIQVMIKNITLQNK